MGSSDDFVANRSFELGPDVHVNVRNLRRALGSVATELSAARLAGLVSAAHPTRRVSASQVQRWEVDVEPDFLSTKIMAHYAGVSFEAFALGSTQYAMVGATIPRLRAVYPDESDEVLEMVGDTMRLTGLPPLARAMMDAVRELGADADPDAALELYLRRRAERGKSESATPQRRVAETEPPPVPAPRGKTHAEAVNELKKSDEKKPKRA